MPTTVICYSVVIVFFYIVVKDVEEEKGVLRCDSEVGEKGRLLNGC